MKTETYRACWSMGRFFPEDRTELVERVDLNLPIPPWCACYEFRTKTIQEANLKDGTVREIVDWKNIPGRYFPGGEIVARENLPSGEDFKILRDNARCNGYEKLIKTRFGGWVEFREGDVVLSRYRVAEPELAT